MAKGSLDFSSVVTKEGKWYVATSPEVGVTSQGKNFEAALENLREAIELYLEDDEAKIPEGNNRPIVTVVKVARP
ncbi:MAG: type II toxin-antitoxin system HicB family antitoxin [Candidatus Bathyarchaeia archaeon]